MDKTTRALPLHLPLPRRCATLAPTSRTLAVPRFSRTTRSRVTSSQTERRSLATEATSPPFPPNGSGNSSKLRRPRTAMFFPGQGVQRIGMLTPWLEAFPRTVKPLLEEIDAITQRPLTELVESGRNSTLTETANAQPAIMATSIVILRVLEREFSFDLAARVDVTLGHSLGEFAALVAGGYVRFDDALGLVGARAEAMSKAAAAAREEEGGEVGMVALICEEEKLADMIASIQEFTSPGGSGSKDDSSHEIPAVQQVLIANINSKNQVVVSGSLARIKTLLTNLREFGGHDPRAVELKSDCPFHSPLMVPGREVMKRLLAQKRKSDGEDIIVWPGIMPCVSNVTARPFRSREELKDLLARQCVETVQWWDSIRFLDQEWKVRRWIGMGPGKVGRNLVGKEVGMKGVVKGGGVWGVSDPKEVEGVLRGLEDTENVDEEDEAREKEMESTEQAKDERKSAKDAKFAAPFP